MEFQLTSPNSFHSISQSFASVSESLASDSSLSDYISRLESPQIPHQPLLPSKRYGITSIQSLASYVNDSSFNSESISPRLRGCDVYIGIYGPDHSMSRFIKWLRAELELQGISCFVVDRNKCKNDNEKNTAKAMMDAASIAVVVISKRSFSNAISMEEMQYFLEKSKLVPIFYNIKQVECNAKDIVEKKGDAWEQLGGRLWELYSGSEDNWKNTVKAISRMSLKVEVNSDNLRDCVYEAMVVLGSCLGRRTVTERVSSSKNMEEEEFPFPRNDNFVGRERELRDIESQLFQCHSTEKKKTVEEVEDRRRKGKQPMTAPVDEMETENGAVCITGESGIGKTELLLEYAYRYSQRYKLVLWIGGESKYLRHNYIKLMPVLDIDASMMSKICNESHNLERMEEEVIQKVKKELSRDIPYLLVIDNLEREKDWWDGKNILELLPNSSGASHVLISTRLSRVMHIKAMKLLYLSNVEATCLMKGNVNTLEAEDSDALSLIAEKAGRLPIVSAFIASIISDKQIKPLKLLNEIHNMPCKEIQWNDGEDTILKHNPFIVQLLDYLYSITDQEISKLAIWVVQASIFFAPSSVPIPMLALTIRDNIENYSTRFWNNCLCMSVSKRWKISEFEVFSTLRKNWVAKSNRRSDCIHFHDIVKLYALKRGSVDVVHSVFRAICTEGSLPKHLDHIWAACFLLFKFENDQMTISLPVDELLSFIENYVIPLSVHCFNTHFRGNAVLELLRVATEKLEELEASFICERDGSLSNGLIGASFRSTVQFNPEIYKRFAHVRATLLEMRAKIMTRGGLYDIGVRLCGAAVNIKEVIYGMDHPETASTRETLEKLSRFQFES